MECVARQLWMISTSPCPHMSMFWCATHSIEDLQRIVEQKGYSAFTVSSGQPSFGHAALKKFPYQLTAGHCKPITTCCNHPCTIYIWSGGGSGSPSGKVA